MYMPSFISEKPWGSRKFPFITGVLIKVINFGKATCSSSKHLLACLVCSRTNGRSSVPGGVFFGVDLLQPTRPYQVCSFHEAPVSWRPFFRRPRASPHFELEAIFTHQPLDRRGAHRTSRAIPAGRPGLAGQHQSGGPGLSWFFRAFRMAWCLVYQDHPVWVSCPEITK